TLPLVEWAVRQEWGKDIAGEASMSIGVAFCHLLAQLNRVEVAKLIRGIIYDRLKEM
ncbi:hypothetical protein LCGC14_2955470, partial [marine sediment metagenome]